MDAAQRKLRSPAAARNREPILEVLRKVLPSHGLVLEIASGSGEHALHFAPALPNIEWQPSDRDESALASIAAYQSESGLANLRPPLHIDVTSETWPVTQADALFCANMIHIAPWQACLGLFRGAAQLLRQGAPLVLYGPFHMGGLPTSPSNAEFDRSLRERDPSWGVRNLEEVTAVAERNRFTRIEVIAMPANNQTLVFERG